MKNLLLGYQILLNAYKNVKMHHIEKQNVLNRLRTGHLETIHNNKNAKARRYYHSLALKQSTRSMWRKHKELRIGKVLKTRKFVFIMTT